RKFAPARACAVTRARSGGLLHFARQLAFLREVEEAVNRIEGVLALLAVVIVAFEGNWPGEAAHRVFPVTSLHRDPLAALRAAFPVGFSGFIRLSIASSPGSPLSPLSFSTASSMSVIVMPSRYSSSA